jgi:hypothetical protein
VARYPRDPRARMARAVQHLHDGDRAAATADLRQGLREQALLERAFPDRQLEIAMRAYLADLLSGEGKRDEARAVVAPVCHAGAGGGKPELLAPTGFCD